MRRIAVLVAVCGLVGLARAADKADPTQGTWVVESVVRDGQPDAGLQGATRAHDGTKYTVTPAPASKAAKVTGTLTVDAGKSPMTLDMKPESGRYKDKTLHGIAKVEGDTLTVCFAEPGKERPTAFESKVGSGWVLAVHKKK